MLHAGFAGAGFDELEQFPSDALIFMGGGDEQVGEFGFFLFGIEMEGDAGDGVLVDFVKVVVPDLPFDFGAGAFDEFRAVDGFAGEQEELADVLFEGAADLFVFVGVDEGADAFVGEDLGEQGFVLTAVDEVDAGDAGAAGLGGELGLGQQFGGEIVALPGEEQVEFAGQDLADEAVAAGESVAAGDVDDLGGFEGLPEGDGDGVGVDAVGMAFAVEAERRNDREDALGEEPLEHVDVDAFDLAGEEVVDASENAEGMGDDGVGGGGADVVGGEAFEDLVGEPVGGGEGKFEGRFVGDSGAVEIGGGGTGFDGQLLDHRGGAVDQDDTDAEGAEDGDVEEDVREVLAHDDGGVDGEDERAFAEPRDVAEDAAEVCGFHGIVGIFGSWGSGGTEATGGAI